MGIPPNHPVVMDDHDDQYCHHGDDWGSPWEAHFGKAKLILKSEALNPQFQSDENDNLVIGGFNPSEKYESQMGVWNSQYMEKHKTCSKPPTSDSHFLVMLINSPIFRSPGWWDFSNPAGSWILWQNGMISRVKNHSFPSKKPWFP